MTSVAQEMLILAIGDIHFRPDNTLQTAALATSLKAVIRAERPNLIVVLGDVLDTHDRIDLNTFTKATLFLEELLLVQQECIQPAAGPRLAVLIGNHDRPNNCGYAPEDHPFNAMRLWPDTVIIDAPRRLEYPSLGVALGMFPYFPPGKFPNIENTVGTCDCLFAHQEFRGSLYGPFPSKTGDIYPLDAPLCVSGHIHKQSSPSPNIFYPGTPIDHAWEIRDADTPATTCSSSQSTSVCMLSINPATGPITKRCLPIIGVPRRVTLVYQSASAAIAAASRRAIPGVHTSGEGIDRVRVKCESRAEYTTVRTAIEASVFATSTSRAFAVSSVLPEYKRGDMLITAPVSTASAVEITQTPKIVPNISFATALTLSLRTMANGVQISTCITRIIRDAGRTGDVWMSLADRLEHLHDAAPKRKPYKIRRVDESH